MFEKPTRSRFRIHLISEAQSHAQTPRAAFSAYSCPTGMPDDFYDDGAATVDAATSVVKDGSFVHLVRRRPRGRARAFKYLLSRPACARSIKPLLLTTCGAWVQLG